MLGSSDRTVSQATNDQVFYKSNIGPQLQNGFNTGGGVWNNLRGLGRYAVERTGRYYLSGDRLLLGERIEESERNGRAHALL